MLSSICVFCGSSGGARPEYLAVAAEFGRMLAATGRTLVYGGGATGIMGAVADGMLAGGGRVIGVIPRSLALKEIMHEGATEMHVVETMHERKALMASLADAFVVLPGGFGTMEEMFETITWLQLGIHRKPCGALNVAGYYDPLVAMIERFIEEGFVADEHRSLLLVDTDPVRLIDRMTAHPPPPLPRWLRPDQT